MRFKSIRKAVLLLIFISLIGILCLSKWNWETINAFDALGRTDQNGKNFIWGGRQKRIKSVQFVDEYDNEELNKMELFVEMFQKNLSIAINSSVLGTLKETDRKSEGYLTFDMPRESESPTNESTANLTTKPLYLELSTSPALELSDYIATGKAVREDSHIHPPRRNRTKKKPPDIRYHGYLNVHIWEAWCGFTVEALRRNKHFPLYPDSMTITTKFYARHYEADFGQRIFGYVHPPETGNYTFAISSDDNSELWLSNSSNPKYVRKIAWVGDEQNSERTGLGQFNELLGQKSKPIFLVEGKRYYVEALHKQAGFRDHILVAWKRPNATTFKMIGRKHISAYMDEDDVSQDVNDLAEYVPETEASFPTHFHLSSDDRYSLNRSIFKFGLSDSRDHFHKTPLVDEDDLQILFPGCSYKPSYLVDFKVKRYEGVYLVHETAVYPDDQTELAHMLPFSDCDRRTIDSHGNSLYTTAVTQTHRNTNPTTISRPEYNDSMKQRIAFLLNRLKKGQLWYQKYLKSLTHSNKFENVTKNKDSSSYGVKVHRSKHVDTKNSTEDISKKNFKFKRRDRLERSSSAKFARVDLKRLKRIKNKKAKKLRAKPVIGRKLLGLAVGEQKVKYAADIDDEGLPSSLNNYKTKRKLVYPSIKNENGNAEGNSERSENTDPTREDALSDKESNKPRRTSKLYFRTQKDVLKYYKIFRSALYTISKDIPRPDTWKFKQNVSECKTDGNLVLSSQVAKSVVKKVMVALEKKYRDKYKLKRIVNVEENHDVINGDRYLIELDLKVKGHGEKSYRLSKYVYQKLGTVELCYPDGFRWDPHRTVHVIVPVKNQGRWVQHFIDNMEEIYLETADSHLNVIIVDFNSTDIDIALSLKKSKLKRYQLINMDGPFQRALGVQAGVDAVKDPHDIIFTCDLHLEIPSQLIDSIRKHCVEGKMAFAPIVVRLQCGYTPEKPYGLWEIQGYGLFAIFKSDFDAVGGMNTKEFKTKWGGEDWEMVDRVLSHGLEIERLRIPKFYHYYHSKKRMWVDKQKQQASEERSYY